ncbi:hypothetical protein CRUP_012495, partial [Coryphaenoides rupestris]
MAGLYTELYATKSPSPPHATPSSPDPEGRGQTEAYRGRSLSPLTLPPLTGRYHDNQRPCLSLLVLSTRNHTKSGLSLSWEEPLPTPVYALHHQGSQDSNPYVTLETPPPSPQAYDPAGGLSPLSRRKKLFTFSRPPRSRDTDRFLDALSEQLGHRVTLVDDFLPRENDYEEMSYKDDQEQGFLSRQHSSSSEGHSSSDEAASSSSGSEPIPPPPSQSPPPPPPFQTPIPPPFQFTDPLPLVRFSPEHVPRGRTAFQPQHPIIPPPPPPPRLLLAARPRHPGGPSRGEAGAASASLPGNLLSRPAVRGPDPVRRPDAGRPTVLRPSHLVLQRHHQLHHQHSYQGPLPPAPQDPAPAQTHSLGRGPTISPLLPQSYKAPLLDLQSQRGAECLEAPGCRVSGSSRVQSVWKLQGAECLEAPGCRVSGSSRVQSVWRLQGAECLEAPGCRVSGSSRVQSVWKLQGAECLEAP